MQTLQPVSYHIKKISLSPQMHQQRFLDNVQSVLHNEDNYCTGTLFNQKHSVRFKTSIGLPCPFCHHSDSALHILQFFNTISSPV